MKINWHFLSPIPNTLCVGEERKLTAEEVAEVNRILASHFEDMCRLTDLFNQARERFKKVSK